MTSNNQKLMKAFVDAFSIEEKEINEGLEYNTIAAWDSVGHMKLISELENVFDIMMDTEDIIDLSSYAKGKEILKKYGVAFE